jgi:hypothetical protein
MSSAALVLHRGARFVEREEFSAIDAPPPTRTWFPIAHRDVLHGTIETLDAAGFDPLVLRLGLSRDNHRFFGVLSLRSAVAPGVDLAVGVRNSTDRSLPIAFCAGHRVFVCDNLAFSSAVVVSRKHTRFGAERFREAMHHAVAGLSEFQAIEAKQLRVGPCQPSRPSSSLARMAESVVRRVPRADGVEPFQRLHVGAARSATRQAKRGFVLLPRRWVVERTFGWLGRFRRLARDYERLGKTLEGLHWLAAVALLLGKAAFP